MRNPVNGAIALVLTAGIIVAMARIVGSGGVSVVADVLSLFMLLTPFLIRQLERLSVRSTERVPSLNSYNMNAGVLVVIGAFVLFGAHTLVGGIMGFIAGMLEVQDALLAATAFAQLVVLIPVTFALGIWIGRRASVFAVLTVLGAVILFRVVSFTLDDLARIYESGAQTTFSAEVARGLRTSALPIVVLAVPGILGVWRGRLTRMQAYLAYLAGLLPVDTRSALVNLAHREVARSIKAKDRGTA
jgi:hypothetical protein